MSLPILTPEEIRVLGALIEKSRTTPDYYPMTLNALTAACNQKSARHPVVEYDEATVIITLDSLKRKALVATAIGSTSRTTKYKHNFDIIFPISDGEIAILCLLFLRGPLTAGEIKNNAGKLHEFSSLENVIEQLQNLKQAEIPFIQELTRRPGQKEARVIHLFSPYEESAIEDVIITEPARRSVNELEERLQKVEQELEMVKTKLDDLLKQLN
jgi:uncharacterized protein